MTSTNITNFPGKVAIGSNVFIDDTASNKLVITGSISTTGTLSGDGSGIDNIQTSNVIGLTDNVARIGTLEADLSDNSSRIGTLEADLSDNSSRITNIESGDITITGKKTFQDDVILESNLRVQGDLLVANTVNMVVSDPIMELGSNNLNTGDLGIVMTRHGAANSNVAIFFDESEDIFNVGYTTSNAYNSTIAIETNNPITMNVHGNLEASHFKGDGSALSGIQSSNVSDFASNVTRITNLESGDLTIDGEKTFSSNLEVGTANLFVDTTTGSVGVGTNSPATYLHLSAKNSDPGATEGDFVGTHNLTEYLRFTSRGDGGDVNSVTVGFKLGADDNHTLNPDGRLDICANDGASVANSYGKTPDKTIATFLGSGNVGIGTTDPFRPRTIESTSYGGLRVKRTTSGGGSAMEFINGNEDIWTVGVGGTGVFGVYKDSIFGEQFLIDTSGNVGIGTDSPLNILHLSSDNTTLDASDSATFDQYSLIIHNTRGTNSTNTELGLCFNHYDSSYPSGSRTPGAAITHERTDAWSKGKLHFKTKSGNTEDGSCDTRMTIDEVGNVGIGLASPAQKLDVAGRIRADTMEIDSYIYHVGDSDTYFGFSNDDHFRIVEGGDTRFQVDSSGYIGIGTITPSSPLHVSASTTSTHTMRITHNDTNATSPTSALFIDANYSGSDTFTGNKTNAGLNIDLDSSATGGGTAEEHRIYGIRSDVRHSGDSDLTYGIYSYVRSDHTSGTTTNLRAGDFIAVASGTGANSTIYGINAIALKGAASTSDTTTMYGVRGEVEVDAGTCTNAYAFQSQIDRDGGTITTGYLYYGSYAGTVGTKWGTYLTGETKNYFSGNVGIGVSNPSQKLDVNGYIKSKLIAFHAYNDSGGDQSSGTTFPANVEIYDYGGCYNTSNYTFSAPVNGLYHFWWYAYTNTSAGTASRWFLKKNGNSNIAQSGQTIGQGGQSYSVDTYLIAGDQIKLTSASVYKMYWYGSISHNGWGCHLVMPA